METCMVCRDNAHTMHAFASIATEIAVSGRFFTVLPTIPGTGKVRMSPVSAIRGGGRLLQQPVREPLPQTAEPIHEQPRLAGARELVRRPRITHQLHRHALLLERHEPELGVPH